MEPQTQDIVAAGSPAEVPNDPGWVVDMIPALKTPIAHVWAHVITPPTPYSNSFSFLLQENVHWRLKLAD